MTRVKKVWKLKKIKFYRKFIKLFLTFFVIYVRKTKVGLFYFLKIIKSRFNLKLKKIKNIDKKLTFVVCRLSFLTCTSVLKRHLKNFLKWSFKTDFFNVKKKCWIGNLPESLTKKGKKMWICCTIFFYLRPNKMKEEEGEDEWMEAGEGFRKRGGKKKEGNDFSLFRCESINNIPSSFSCNSFWFPDPLRLFFSFVQKYNDNSNTIGNFIDLPNNRFFFFNRWVWQKLVFNFKQNYGHLERKQNLIIK